MLSEVYLTEIPGSARSSLLWKLTQQALTEPAVLHKSNRTTCSKPGEVSKQIIQITIASLPYRLLLAVKRVS